MNFKRLSLILPVLLAVFTALVVINSQERTPAHAWVNGCVADSVVSFTQGADLIAPLPESNVYEWDGLIFSLGNGGSIVLEFANDVADRPGNDFTVAEGYAYEAGEILLSDDGINFVSLGTHLISNGSKDFDIATSGLTSIRFVKIIDDNVGDLGVPSLEAGFDLDAVHAWDCTPLTTEDEPIFGRITGGGSNWMIDGARVTKGFELHCDLREPNNFEINWVGGNNFHMTDLTSAICTEDPDIIQAPPPHAPFDTFTGEGTGKLNNVEGATVKFVLVDAGEPGTSDWASIQVYDADDNLVMTVEGLLKKGNFQTHRD